MDDLDAFIDEPELNRALYERLSAGQRLALNCIFHILSKIEPRTLILFDEPELHLHPQLLTGLLHALGEILDSQDSFAIIATHSPIVMAYPDSSLFELSSEGFNKVDYRETEHFKVMKSFIDNPKMMLDIFLT